MFVFVLLFCIVLLEMSLGAGESTCEYCPECRERGKQKNKNETKKENFNKKVMVFMPMVWGDLGSIPKQGLF
jgi:hypothetical protein